MRTCIWCLSGDIENEYHFIMVCPIFNSIRQIYKEKLKYINKNVHTIDMWNCAMGIGDGKALFLGKIFVNNMLKRKQKLETLINT